MLAKRIIPCLDMDHGRVLKGRKFVGLKDVGDPVELALKYGNEGADELVLLDITASVEKRRILLDVVRRVAEVLDIPFTVGGGIRTVEDVRDILTNGGDRVAVNTAAVENPEFVRTLSEIYGSQCVVVAIDAKRVYTKDGLWFEVYTYGGRKPTGIDAIEWAKRVEELGAGEILLTSIDMDGTKDGYDLELIRLISNNVSIPVIASGGCGRPEHFLEAFEAGADAALAASIFHYDEYPIPVVKRFLKERGVHVRL
ncbi:MAG: imidazole glycerol phosphate synthase subunit HisF [Thaumarchaeota archaeon]|jgi:cyclase|nr:imidazole glycerol phosphate synthase subunit HisF [Candidatus Terraquivivens yellowstonensis]MCL7387499.1 imidazole glycerol phosphate synthase subunit HisF [Candidatus Terraquivivens yellowstonensis]MCL7395119.1 imidazole glycerol phosphate synthase subunit HisF [Candidatus Terraquivivens yellowstonensis]MCL7397959.1 imidazole glycerol phosphate synthase subunit HisF [Candidatus Terraquivivens yellowstonensis]MCL7399347.1 imidazole glycerol phosphate synthase subunit HisF [Candidatus Terra